VHAPPRGRGDGPDGEAVYDCGFVQHSIVGNRRADVPVGADYVQARADMLKGQDTEPESPNGIITEDEDGVRAATAEEAAE
jgi:hypothetical protein